MSEFIKRDILKQLKEKYVAYLTVEKTFFNPVNTNRTLDETMVLIRKLVENERRV